MADIQESFAGMHVAALESRSREQMERLIEKYGGVAHVSPSMREVPLEDNREATDLAYRVITGQINIVIFMTGIGFRQWLSAVERSVDVQRLVHALSDIVTVARGPKPAAAMRQVGIQPKYVVPEPNTWRELLQVLDHHVPVANQQVILQEYGTTNASLIAGLEARGADVIPLRLYRYDLPEDTGPLEENIRAIIAGQRDVVLFTSAHQIVNMMRLAEQMQVVHPLRQGLARTIIASIGPTTSEMLRHFEFRVDIEPEHPKMGHLVQTAARRAPALRAGRQAIVALGKTADEPVLDRQAPWYDSPFMRACRREAAGVTPIWLMRQAGRYMAEYRKVREKVGFLELCKNPALCAEVMVTAVERLGVDAAIIFSDLLPILEPMGMELEFAPGDGPVIHNPIRELADVDRVQELDDMEPLAFVMETVRLTRRGIAPHIPVIGFAGSPFTLASYMIEGGASRHYARTKSLMYRDAGAWDVLMQKLARTIARYLNAQIQAGAQCVQLFDSWAGCLSPTDYRRYAQPYVQAIIDAIVPGVPVINFATGNPQLLPALRGDERTVVGVDWRIELDCAWETVGHDRAVQGNLDPVTLLADVATIREAASDVLQRAGGRAGHIFNLGHGILPQTPVEHAIALVDVVHELSQR
ncbi:MAG: uroporphyrinogen decarboxylase [Pirellulaceae bacterium]|nr:MAG: uroporphyrinogen decarboxylase [Pirellulaceae bacterium]